MNVEFKIICIKDCDNAFADMYNKVEKGEIFITNNREFNYTSWYGSPVKGFEYVILNKNGRPFGLYDKSNFMLLEEYRSNKIEDILEPFR